MLLTLVRVKGEMFLDWCDFGEVPQAVTARVTNFDAGEEPVTQSEALAIFTMNSWDEDPNFLQLVRQLLPGGLPVKGMTVEIGDAQVEPIKLLLNAEFDEEDELAAWKQPEGNERSEVEILVIFTWPEAKTVHLEMPVEMQAQAAAVWDAAVAAGEVDDVRIIDHHDAEGVDDDGSVDEE